mmetsp:Transcript_619/g.1300  ORF Transcript_619/g.1300 Transcript_619/m.1300 type:complete len:410 (+) Transcript_619:198-1427(+)|eukprot:CAMPEP_0114251500 /NCGR_PEP_ID=MMETSP0058-20121206/15305_1 /TAXON_ID=36894 /ORGANISM="Pyramimonas parkeae, CCMP726" /LENGTH=409 /DNA_ID=CAMNT_0001365309 /DNA_START=186 /DNA_END=1415 /DNA_ORIENTATION=+
MAYPVALSTLDTQLDDFVLKLKRRQIEGSIHIARKTTELLRQVVSSQNRCSAESLREAVRRVGKLLVAAKPCELCISNMVRRVLFFIREEEQQEAAPEDTDEDDDAQQQEQNALGAPKWSQLGPSCTTPSAVQGLVRAGSLASLLEKGLNPLAMDTNVSHVRVAHSPAASSDPRRLKHNVIESINELIDELDSIRGVIAEQGSEHIHSNEVVLTFGGSNTVFEFLKEAAKKRSFSAVVSEGAPDFRGHKFAKRLAALPSVVQTTVIADAAIFAMMARVNMVVVGARAVLANGGVVGPLGLHTVALAAARHAVPLVVLTGLHKLSPEQPFDPEITMNDLKSPAEVVNFEALSEGSTDASTNGTQLHVVNPAYDYVPPHLISLFITDSGGHAPSYVYRLLAEYYSPEDNVL